nr:myb-like protein X [Tanacetum cinerariifolium]
MYRNSPVRNPRAKGIKGKNVLQVCLLVAVCFWLIFQVKRSHDKRKEFDASDNKVSLSSLTRSGEEIAKLGRKDLQPKLEKTGNVGQEEEDEQEENKGEDEEQDEHDDNKHEEEEQDEDKIEEEKDDGRDDEIDENEQEKPDVEIDREEVDVGGEEKETEESDEKENENISEEKDVQSQTENEVSSDDHNEDGDTEHTHEAREENYKADDASSAVTHTGRTLGTENEIKNGTIVALSENVGQTAENGTSTSSNTTVIQENNPEPLISDVSPTSSIDSSENGPPADTTLITSQSTETQNIREFNESSSDPSKTELETETNNITEGTEETIDPDEVQHDTIDSTDLPHLEEKDVRTDLDTLPDIETEGGNNEDTAAE